MHIAQKIKIIRIAAKAPGKEGVKRSEETGYEHSAGKKNCLDPFGRRGKRRLPDWNVSGSGGSGYG